MKRYTYRDSCGNAKINCEDVYTQDQYRAFLNHVATLEDWFDALIKDNSPLLENKIIKYLVDLELDAPCDEFGGTKWCNEHCRHSQALPDADCWKHFFKHI